MRPTIQGPASSVRTGLPPSFTVNPGANRYYSIEVATRPELFNHAAYASQRNDSNFFGSWRVTPFGFAANYPATYTLSADVWQRLRENATRLYYRLWATDSPNQWLNSAVTTPDREAQAAPAITIETGASTPVGVPSILAPNSLPNSAATPPVFQVNPGANRYYAVEVATRPELFNHATYASQRNDDNFFGSWRAMPFGFASVYPTSYQLPAQAWERLRRNATRLYYRLWATDSPNSWVNSVTATPDSGTSAAPMLSLTREAEPDGVPSVSHLAAGASLIK
jgi:hypothetical protein